ncbi:MAG: hypothetical protein COW02_18305 [Comamonadaceae bacterium CG12_big_fil_rev_8_21_14_0_65_59_15]|nr:MAG: hypothetical protein COW02_18305 [Comamonadaceae bacterium CG12_big_fil_rev_8_21_14_0_65_59_15]
MLTELFQIARNLAGQGIKTGLVHKDLGIPGLSTLPTLRVVLNEDGVIVRILPITKDEEPGLWTLQSGNFKFFPAVRLKLIPALPVPAELLEKKSVNLQDVIALLDISKQLSKRKIDSEMVDGANKNRQRIRSWQSIEEGEILAQLKKFSTSFDKFCESTESAALNLLKGIENSLQSPQDEKTLATFANLLAGQSFVGKKNKDEKIKAEKKPKKEEDRIQLCFDFKPSDDLTFTLYSPRVKQVVLECLAIENVDQKSNIKKANSQNGACAFASQTAEPLTTPFPKWSARPVINKPLSPFSKFSDAACNFRYQRADSDAFPIGAETARMLVAAITEITSKPQGSNWRALRNGKFDKQREEQDVLIAYPTMSLEDLPLVNLFAKSDELPDDGIKEFQDQARQVIEAFSKIVLPDQVPDYIIILLIRQISSGQMQLAYSANPSRTEFVSAVDAWSESANNLPPNLCVPLILRAKTDQAVEKLGTAKQANKTVRWVRPKLLFPEEISRLLSRQWIRSGVETSVVEAPAVGQILDLFLRKPGVWQDIAANLLEVTLTRTSVLLTHAGHVLHRDDPITLVKWSEFSFKSKAWPWPDYALSQTLSLIGSLLYAMNSNVKNYVEESAYHIGRLLAMMDELHKCYCIAVRDGDVPNSLIGNGLLGRAADSPAQALAELAERSRIYMGWAKSVDVTDFGEKAKKKNIAIYSARKVLRLAAPLCEQLHATGSLDAEMSTVQKAHLFLGYLAPILGQEDGREIPSEAATDTADATTTTN